MADRSDTREAQKIKSFLVRSEAARLSGAPVPDGVHTAFEALARLSHGAREKTLPCDNDEGGDGGDDGQQAEANAEDCSEAQEVSDLRDVASAVQPDAAQAEGSSESVRCARKCASYHPGCDWPDCLSTPFAADRSDTREATT